MGEVTKYNNINFNSIDEGLIFLCSQPLKTTVYVAEHADNAKKHLCSRLILDAITGGNNKFPGDIRECRQIIQRVDGSVIKDSEIGKYNSMSKECLEHVLENCTNFSDTVPTADDTAMLAIAKIIYRFSLLSTGNNQAKKTEKDIAIQIILDRCGGRRATPKEKTKEVVYSQPLWLS
jgi:hypothetical protein